MASIHPVSSKAKNYLIIVLALATVFTGAVAWQQSRKLTALNDDLLKSKAVAAKPKSAPVAAAFSNPTPAAEPAAPGEEPAENAEARQNRQRNNNNRPNMAALLANPEFAKAAALQQRAALDNRYAALFKQLNLSPTDLEKFKDLLIERQNSRMDVMAAARESGLNPRENRDELKKLTDEAQADVDANIKSTLGDAAYSKYQNYDTTGSQRAVVSQVTDRLSYTSTPLTAAQSEFLVSALSTTSTTDGTNATGNNGGGPGGGGPGGGGWGGMGGGGNTTTITDAVIVQAQSVLTADQVTALKAVQAEQQAQQTMREIMRAQTAEANAAKKATTTKAK